MADRVKEKLIELLGADVCKHDCCDDCEYGQNRDACIAFLKESMADHLISNCVTFAKDINAPIKWIPVTERLPEYSGKVLVHCVTGYIGVESYSENKGFNSVGVWIPVTHWMPLPEPPKGE